MSSNRSRILLADDHNLVAELCKGLLETEFDVVGIVCNGYPSHKNRYVRAKLGPNRSVRREELVTLTALQKSLDLNARCEGPT